MQCKPTSVLDLLIVIPKGACSGNEFPPVRLGYLMDELAAIEICSRILDANLQYSIENIIEETIQAAPKLLVLWYGEIAEDICCHEFVQSLFKQIQAIRSLEGLKTCVMGVLPTIFATSILDSIPADYALAGEPAKGLAKLLAKVEKSQIDGLVYRKGDRTVKHVPNRDWNLRNSSFPKYQDFEITKYSKKGIHLLGSRGCPMKCVFCHHPLMTEHQFDAARPEAVVMEMLYWVEQGFHTFVFEDDYFALDQKWFDAFYQRVISQEKLRGIQIRIPNASVSTALQPFSLSGLLLPEMGKGDH